ncbi:MAG: hypothetical protein IJ147_13150 [Lachnospiraceae bacterium]|nr:hypothetical protein [Lachnospiraceae bacterium]
MSVRERVSGIWLMAMTLLSLFAFTCYFVAQMRLNILQTGYLMLVILQGVALAVYMWGPEKLKFKWQRILYRLLYASSFCVIPAFAFIFMGLVSQYHVRIPDSISAENLPVEEILPADKTVVYDTGIVYVIFPEYSSVSLVCEDRPSKSDKTITWCSGAAFQHTVSLGFAQEDVEGDHAVSGTLYESPYNKDDFAAFTCVGNRFSFEFDEPSEAVKDAAEAGGSGFMQFGLIRDGENVMNFDLPRVRCYRTLAELNGNLCIIDSCRMMKFDDFLEEVSRLGVTNALYMDMGAGWNYSWYRNKADKVVTLFGLPVPWSHNWIIFQK